MEDSVILSNGIVQEKHEYEVNKNIKLEDQTLPEEKTFLVTKITEDSIIIKPTHSDKKYKLHYGEFEMMLEKDMIRNIGFHGNNEYDTIR